MIIYLAMFVPHLLIFVVWLPKPVPKKKQSPTPRQKIRDLYRACDYILRMNERIN